jgi:tetratricopeptide (TPR) repeat protein
MALRARGHPIGACPPRVLAERPVEGEHVADLALDRQSRRRGRRAPARGLTAAALTKSAVDHLRAGRWQAAADVFAGLVALRPADGDAWNNLGFCQLPLDRAAALRSLQQASLYERDNPAVNAANRALALHLVGRDDEALRVADAGLTIPGQSIPSILWRHHGPDAPLVLDETVDTAQYLSELRHHVAAEGCRTTA